MLMVTQSKRLKLIKLLAFLLSIGLLLISFKSLAEETAEDLSSQVELAQDEAVNNELVKDEIIKTNTIETDASVEQNFEIKKIEKILEENNISSKDISRKDEIYQSAVGFAQWVDNFFGEAEELESASYDYLRLVNTIGWREGEGVQYRPRVKAKVNLPRMDKKLSLMFADNDDLTNSEFESLQNNDLFKQDNHKTSAAPPPFSAMGDTLFK